MARKLSFMGSLLRAPVLRNAAQRRLVFAGAIAICGVLTLYPEKYHAAMSLTPADPASLVLGGTLGQLGAINSVFGNQSSVEVSMRVAQSAYVQGKVTSKLKLAQRFGIDEVHAQRWLNREVDVRSMRGGIMMFEMTSRDAPFARDVIEAYGEAVREQLGIIARKQTAYKRQILLDLVNEASDRLEKAQTAYDSFRLQTRYSQPQSAIRAIGERIPALEAAIKGKQVELNAQRQFATDENMKVRQILAEIESLQQQLSEAKSVSPGEQNSVGRVVRESTQADKLRRDLDIAQGLYDNYKRFLQGTSVEDMTSNANVRVLEPAYVDPARQYNWGPLMLGILLGMLAIVMEFFLLRPPIGEGHEA